ncbi:MAG TPA: ATP-grasp domain-containing protein [Anaerolineales bacterium]|nr:ATP-grasp domain-containing protein [Anaerolineales bacterium]
MTSTRNDTNPSSILPFQRDLNDELEEPPGTHPLAATITSTERIGTAARIDTAAPQPAAVPSPRTRSRARSTALPAVPGRRARVNLSRARVLVVYDLALGLERGRPEDILADETVEAVACGIAEALQPQVAEVRLVPVWDDLLSALRPYSPSDWVVFNLCESLGGRAFTEALVPRDLSRLGFRHTGSSHATLRLSTDKAKTKCLARSLGLTTPRFRVFRTGEERPIRLHFPLIVKPVAEGGSFGVRGDSVARDPSELWPKIENCVQTYRQPALVEEFIVGREINVALWGNGRPQVLPISEINFEWTDDPLQKIVSFDSKWVKTSPEYSGTPARCPAKLTTRERNRIEAAAISMYSAVKVHGYARVDMRLRDGQPYVLEVNANPDLSLDAGFFRSASAAGYSYPGMLAEILRLSLM